MLRFLFLAVLCMAGMTTALVAQQSVGHSDLHDYGNATHTSFTSRPFSKTSSDSAPAKSDDTTNYPPTTTPEALFTIQTDTRLSTPTDPATTTPGPLKITVYNKAAAVTTIELTSSVFALPAYTNAINILGSMFAYLCPESGWKGDCKNYFMLDLDYDNKRCTNLVGHGGTRVKSMGPDEGVRCWAFPADVSDCSGPPLGNKTHEAMEFVFPGIGRLEAAGVETEWGSFSCSRETRMSAAAVHAMPAANENGG